MNKVNALALLAGLALAAPALADNVSRDEVRAMVAEMLADAETRAREQRYRAVFEQAHNGFLLHRADGALLDLNHKAAELFGASTEALRAAAPAGGEAAAAVVQGNYPSRTPGATGGEGAGEGVEVCGRAREAGKAHDGRRFKQP